MSVAKFLLHLLWELTQVLKGWESQACPRVCVCVRVCVHPLM